VRDCREGLPFFGAPCRWLRRAAIWFIRTTEIKQINCSLATMHLRQLLQLLQQSGLSSAVMGRRGCVTFTYRLYVLALAFSSCVRRASLVHGKPAQPTAAGRFNESNL